MQKETPRGADLAVEKAPFNAATFPAEPIRRPETGAYEVYTATWVTTA
jgi:hypothetical protein